MERSREVDKEGIGSDACQRCLSSRELELGSLTAFTSLRAQHNVPHLSQLSTVDCRMKVYMNENMVL